MLFSEENDFVSLKAKIPHFNTKYIFIEQENKIITILKSIDNVNIQSSGRASGKGLTNALYLLGYK